MQAARGRLQDVLAWVQTVDTAVAVRQFGVISMAAVVADIPVVAVVATTLHSTAVVVVVHIIAEPARQILQVINRETASLRSHILLELLPRLEASLGLLLFVQVITQLILFLQ